MDKNRHIDAIRRRFQKADRLQNEEPDAYRDITAELREKSLNRHEKKLAEISDLQDELRLKLFKWIALSLALLLVGIAALTYSRSDSSQEAPQQLATWLEQQKMLKQVAQVQQWLQNGEAESDMPPPRNLEELQAWLDQIRLSPDLQKLEEESLASGPGFVPFQCPVGPIHCPADDIPSASGDNRVELSHLVRNANTMLVDNGNCEGTVNLIGEYNSLFGWRKSEAITKSLLETSVARCFMDAKKPDNAEVHYTRAYCASVSNPDPHEAMNSLYGLAKIAWQRNDQARLHNYINCSESLLDYHLRADPDVNTLNNYITLSLMHYELTDDTRESIRLEKKALAAARDLASKVEAHQVEDHLEVMLILQMNLMEGYLTLGESEPLYELHEELKSNPMLEEGDRLIARGLLLMQDLIDGDKVAARKNLNAIINRYKALSEFDTIWSWDAFDRWQERTKSSRNQSTDKAIRELRLVLAPDRPADALQRLNLLLATIGAG